MPPALVSHLLGTLLLLVLVPSVALAQIVLPFNEGFEGTSGEIYTSSTGALTGAADWSYANTDPAGRLRTAAGVGYARTGAAAVTLDRSPAGIEQTNYLVLSLDLSSYDVASDTVVLDFGVMDHGEEPHPGDRVWVRGSGSSAWVEIADLGALVGPVGTYAFLEDLNVSGALAAAGQQFSATTALRFGQQDDSPSTGISNGDGLTFDDVALRLVDPDDVSPSAVLSPPAGECGGDAMYLEVEVVNLGGNTVLNVPVEVEVAAADGTVTPLTGIAAGPLEFLDTETVVVGPVDLFAGGTIDVLVTTMLPGDTDPVNDILLETIELAPGAVPLDPIDGACPGLPTTLTVAAEGATVYRWWDAPTAGNALAVGDAYTTPPLSAETTYWVSRVTATDTVGAIDNTIGTGGWFPDYADGLVFDVTVPSNLDSVVVYAEAAGDLTLRLLDSAGVVLDTATQPVVTGMNVVPVDLALPVATGLQLDAVGSTVPNLFRNTGGAVFPYTTGGAEVVVTGAINGLPDYWYYFYDWEVTVGGCDEQRTEVVVPVGIAECDTDLQTVVTGPAAVVPGTTVDYVVEVTNAGPDPLSAVEIDVLAAAGFPGAALAGDCASFPCSPGAMAPGGTFTTTVSYDVPADLPGPDPVEFVATAVPTGGETDPDPDAAETTLPLPFERHVDLAVFVTEEGDPVLVGGTARYTVEVTNDGPSAAMVGLSSSLPIEFAPVRTPAELCAEGIQAVPVCSLGLVSPGETVSVLYEGEVPVATLPGTVTAQWTASADGVEDFPGDEVWAEMSELALGADLTLDVTVDGEALAGGTVDLVVRASNAGPESVSQGYVKFSLPAGLDVATLPSECEADLDCRLPGLALGESAELTFPIAVDGTATGELEVGVQGRSEYIDPDDSDNDLLIPVEVVAAAGFEVSATVGDGPFFGADAIDVMVRVTGLGPADVEDAVIVFDMPPAGLTADGCVENAAYDTECPLGAVAADETVETTVTLRADIEALGTFRVPVWVASSAADSGQGGATELVIEIVADDGSDSCAGCESSMSREPGSLALLLLLPLLVRRRR